MYNITLTLDGSSRIPMYEQLYRYFAEEIQSGRLPAGTKMPSKRSLCAHLGVSRSTVENSYAILVAEGYVQAVAKSGFYVADLVPFGATTAAVAALVERPAPAQPRVNFSTSVVDTRTDARIREAMRAYIPETTKIIIAQRTASVQDADHIIVMEGGRIDAIGTHAELMAGNDIYREIYTSQNKAGD